ncbi:methylated-DNA--[protein]-cysteine S-methyltransferase [Chelativorans salis]|uniref:Methylated-DNA--[protein]-cysteine S-methyltransferase n=1 Tax=Chelativorans salis TaxID=2978478 RepID=A0ABT2LJW9_9HYPH|nr:methylated-DNA--[protein]-cysteine S-methyltransferase [Chelativorans sp. EGI FJ00035]MCT7374890.1 methylated-DNA--[protein]-cysteine S-methyltransferase [Chelativorans sp. EGI FJ00035]
MTSQHVSFHHVFETAFGFCGIGWTEHGIARFMLPMATPESVAETLVKRTPGSREAAPTGTTAEVVAAATRYFAGEREDFSAIALDLDGVDPFRRAIYAAARRLGYGETTTYGALAEEAGFPEAARETGTALGRNPVPLIVPCHRILAAGGKLGGFSAPGGTTTKLKMLALERAVPPGAEPAQASFAF